MKMRHYSNGFAICLLLQGVNIWHRGVLLHMLGSLEHVQCKHCYLLMTASRAGPDRDITFFLRAAVVHSNEHLEHMLGGICMPLSGV